MTHPPRVSEESLAGLRDDLVGYCYRMLAEAAEAEDAAQETLLRAWRGRDRFDPDRGSLRGWLFAIASNVCADFHRSPQRRALPIDISPSSHPGDDIGQPAHDRWVTPLPSAGGDPGDTVAQRDSVRLALVAALQRLPPTQRAAVLLRDVYEFSAEETARLLGTSGAAVHSAVRRARATLERADHRGDRESVNADTVGRYVTAFEAHDLDALARILHEEVEMSMPPYPFWVAGRQRVLETFASGRGCVGHRLRPTTANGSTAFGQYRPRLVEDTAVAADASHVPFALLVVTWRDCRARTLTTFLDAADRFAEFGLPVILAADPAPPAAPDGRRH